MDQVVSVIVPIYNGEKYLKKSIDSILKQDYSNLEIILINDGSKDESLSIINNYKLSDDRIIIIDKQNEGQAIARNIGLSRATGEYISFVDCDDYIDSSMIKEMYNLSKKNNSDIVCCDLKMISDDSIGIINGLMKATEDNRINFMFSDAGPCAKLFKKSFLNRINFKFLEGRIYEDLAVIPSLSLYTSKISYIEKPLYFYQVHNGSTMKQVKFNKKLLDIFYSMDNLSKLFKDEYRDELEYIYIKYLLHDASLRFLEYDNKKTRQYLFKINSIIKSKYPNWKKNKYLILMNKKEVLITKLFYSNFYFIYRIYRRIVRK